MEAQTLEHADLIMSRLESHGEDYLAYFSAAIDETGGDVSRSIKIADKLCSRSKFAKAGDPDDCGHERKGGKFAGGNTCAAGGGGKRYKVLGSSREERIASISRKLFGKSKSIDEILDLIGYDEFAKVDPDFQPIVNPDPAINEINITYTSKKLSVSRWIMKGQITNDFVRIDPSLAGKGHGLAIFASQVKSAIAAGIPKIECIAAKAGDMNGHYTWARFGYDGVVRSKKWSDKKVEYVAKTLGRTPDEIRKNPIKISDLMKTKRGREFWRDHGSDFDATFDLSEGSLSRRVLSEYLKEKGVDPSSAPNRFRKAKQWAGNLTKSDPGETVTEASKSNSRLRSRKKMTKFSAESGMKSARKSAKSASRAEWHEGDEIIPAGDKTISGLEAGEIIAKQYGRRKRGDTAEEMADVYVTSSRFTLHLIPLWCFRVYDDIKPSDHSYSTGAPIVIDVLKHKRTKRFGSFGSLPNIICLDGKHRWHDAIMAGKTHLEAFIGDQAKPILLSYVKSFWPKRKRFMAALRAFYERPSNKAFNAIVKPGKACGLSTNQIIDIFNEHNRDSYFDPALGEFHSEKPKLSRFVKAGDPDDCGHEIANHPKGIGGDFTQENVCAAGNPRQSQGAGSSKHTEVLHGAVGALKDIVNSLTG
jgi:hypothetical protein